MLTAIVLTYNSQSTLEKCLKSLTWCDEILIVDSFSEDETLAIAREFTSRIFQREYQNYGDQLNFALKKARGEWVLVIDSDEEVSPSLQREIQETLSSPFPLTGFYIPRKSKFLGRWINHCWKGDKVLRLFRKEYAQYRERELGSSPRIEGKVGMLQNPILHYPYRDLKHYLEKLNYYTTCAARQMHKEGRKFRIYNLFLNPLGKFIQMYFLKKGFLDKGEGFLLSLLSSFYVLVKFAKLWEIQRKS